MEPAALLSSLRFLETCGLQISHLVTDRSLFTSSVFICLMHQRQAFWLLHICEKYFEQQTKYVETKYVEFIFLKIIPFDKSGKILDLTDNYFDSWNPCGREARNWGGGIFASADLS